MEHSVQHRRLQFLVYAHIESVCSQALGLCHCGGAFLACGLRQATRRLLDRDRRLGRNRKSSGAGRTFVRFRGL